jgi:hypothetical protein
MAPDICCSHGTTSVACGQLRTLGQFCYNGIYNSGYNSGYNGGAAAVLYQSIAGVQPVAIKEFCVETIVSSRTQEVRIGPDLPFVIIGERINPTGRKNWRRRWRRAISRV